jgi:hypothetical protein
VFASFSRAQYAFHSDDFATQLLVNHLFIRFIRVIRGSIVFRCEGGDDFFEARIAAERIPDRVQF